VFSTPLADTNLAQITTPSKVSTAALTGTVADANLPTLSIAKGGTGQTTASAAANAILPISSYTEKTTLADDDVFLIEDSAASNAKKKVKKSNLAAKLNVSSYATGTSITVGQALTERLGLTTSYVKKKDILVERSGVVQVSYDLRGHDGNPANGGFARIYVNDIAVGTEKEVFANSYTTFTENITVNAGDHVQLYAKKESSGATGAGVKNFYVKRAYTEYVVLD
jgi:hypothetical protein